jgi:zinc transport system ATP-binding protein
LSDKPSVIRLQDVCFSFDHQPVLEEVTFSVEHDDFVSVVGPNGGGKTTLLKIILGLYSPDRGRVELLGQPPKNSRLRAGYTPQYLNVDDLFPVTVRDVVLMGRLGRRWQCRYRREDRREVERAMEEMQVASLADTPFSSLSGGQRQRTLIARTLCSNPEILMMDEPTSNIDPTSEEILFDILKELNQRMTILIVSHDIGVVSQIVNTVICVNRQVVVHPTSELSGEVIRDIYGADMKMVRHDRQCRGKECRHG